MNRARLRVALAVVAAGSIGLVGSSIANATTSDKTPYTPAGMSAASAAAPTLSHFPEPLTSKLRGHQQKATHQKSAPAGTAKHDTALGRTQDAVRDPKQHPSRHTTHSEHTASHRNSAEAPAASRQHTRSKARSKVHARAHKHKCTPPVRVAGLTAAQTYNAKMIVRAGNELRMGWRGKVVALATALQESGLRNYANANVPESMHLRHEAVGYDHDSVGLFQQRQSWGPVRELMTPRLAAIKFYEALERVPGWQYLPVTVAAQTVQVSAYPDAYADNTPEAIAITNSIPCTE